MKPRPLAVLEGDDGRMELNAELAGDRRMLVDVHLDELDASARPRATTFSSAGCSCLHGPHQGAQKSTRTGCLRDSWMTSAAKLAVVVSLNDKRGAAGCPADAGAAP